MLKLDKNILYFFFFGRSVVCGGGGFGVYDRKQTFGRVCKKVVEGEEGEEVEGIC